MTKDQTMGPGEIPVAGAGPMPRSASESGSGDVALPPESGLDPSGGTPEVVHIEAFDPAQVRPWDYHNRTRSGMDDESLEALAASIRRDGQQQLGLARRLPPGDSHVVEAVFGVRRLEACRRAGVPWRAEVREASLSDAHCAALMYGENEWSEGVSPLENARQWKALLEAGVFVNQSALAADIGCSRNTVSRAIKSATALLDEAWIERLVYPVMHELTSRQAERLAAACEDATLKPEAMRRAKALTPGELPAIALYDALFGAAGARMDRETLFERRKRRNRGGPVMAKIDRDRRGGFSVNVRAHEQTDAEQAELAEQIEALLAVEMSGAARVRLGRRLAATLTGEVAKDAERAWLEGCVWSTARASGLEWDRWRCAAVAEVLRAQRGGWERAVVDAIRNASGSKDPESNP
ncbi:MAG: ParB/RepB/Spo0J family partition protein [Gammaproteobacteria bacterium]|nr:ParB/RepB/Spo0J family partition protein [Gammaproteobacteria bacterium]MYF30145.1 ParB/RepB/Spo0J family partition protein [Gammaproteobacteria bacterium]MYK44668.1 ParB/RepB/Spo0J family partition protein [Gammaproteobacteria bacterium]